MTELLSLRKYAETRRARGLPGGTLAAVQRAIASGRVTPISGKIAPELADAQWVRKTDVAQQFRGMNGGYAPRVQPAGKVSTNGHAIDLPARNGDGGRKSYFDVKERRELAEAQKTELELRQMQGELCEVEDAKRAQFEMARMIRDRIMVVPDRVAPLLAACLGDVDKMRSILRDDLKNALRDVASDPLEPTRN